MVDFLNEGVTFESTVTTEGELIANGGVTIGPGGVHVGEPASGLVNSWPVHSRVQVANITERDALVAWRTANDPITPARPLLVWRADGSSTGIQEISTDGLNWFAESPVAGDIEMTLAAVAPYGWLLMQGQTIANAQTLHPALWANADPALRSGTSLRIPDLRGRAPIGAGQGTGLSMRNIGDLVGTETVGLIAANLPTHTHSGTTGGVDRSLNHDHYFRLHHASATNPPGSELELEWHDVWNGTGGIHRTSMVSQTSAANTSTSLDHLHAFTTNGGNGLSGTAHANMQPSAVVNFKVKV